VAKKNILLGDFLVDQNVINEGQLKEALQYHHENGIRLGRSLIDLGFVTENQMIKALSEQLDLQYIDLKTYRIDPEVISLISEQMARNFHVIPLFNVRHRLTVAMVNPLDIFAIDALTRETKMKIEPVVCSEQAIKDALEKYYVEMIPKFAAPEASTNGTSQVIVVKNEAEKDNLLQKIDEFLDALAEKKSRRAFLAGSKLRIEMGSKYEQWPIPEGVETKNFIRLLCNLGEESKIHDSGIGHYIIEKKTDEGPAKFHILVSRIHVEPTLAIYLQMSRAENKSPKPELKIFQKVHDLFPNKHGFQVIATTGKSELEHIYYTLFRRATETKNYPVSLENEPTDLVGNGVQIVCDTQDDFLTGIRFAKNAGADCVFLKNVIAPEIIEEALKLASLNIMVVNGVTSIAPWHVPAQIFKNRENSFFREPISSMYLSAPSSLVHEQSNPDAIASFAELPDMPADKRIASTENDGAFVEYFWESRNEKNNMTPLDKLHAKLLNGMSDSAQAQLQVKGHLP